MSEIARLWVTIGAKTDGLDNSLQGVQKKLDKFSATILRTGAVMTAAVTVPIVAGFKSILDAAMHLEATEAKFNTVFAGMTDDASAFIAEFKKLTPLTTAEARGVASGIQDLLVPMGFARDEATKLTGAFMPLIGALANFNNSTHTAAEVANAVSAALIGEYEPMRRLGVVTSKTAIDQRVLALGMAATSEEITDQMRAIALHQIITESSKDAIAAYTEANLDSKTKLGLLKVEIIDTAAKLGESLIPMMEQAIEWVKQLTTWFNSLTIEQQENILKILAIAAAIGPLLVIFGTLAAAVSNMIGLYTALTAAKVAATAATTTLGAAAGKATATMALWNPWALAIVAAIGLVILYVNDAINAFNRLRAAQDAAAGGTANSVRYDTDKSNLSQWWKKPQGLTFTGMFDTGGVVPGPVGKPGLAIVHGGETILPTHKSGFAGQGFSPNITIQMPDNTSPSAIQRKQEQMLRNMALEWGIA